MKNAEETSFITLPDTRSGNYLNIRKENIIEFSYYENWTNLLVLFARGQKWMQIQYGIKPINDYTFRLLSQNELTQLITELKNI